MTLAIRFFGQTLKVCATNPKVLDYVSSLDSLHVFRTTLLSNVAEVEDSPCLNIIEGQPTILNFEQTTRSLTFQVEWNLIDNTGAIENLLGQLLCLACIDARVFLLHAATISRGDGAYLLIGGVGAGKTQLSVALCTDSKFRWLSNDWVGLSMEDEKVVVSEGDDLINFRKLPFPQMVNVLSKENIALIRSRFPSDSNPWTKSSPPFFPSELGLTLGSLPCQVKGIFFPLVKQKAYEYCQEISRGRAATALLKELTWLLRGIESFVLDNSGKAICPSVTITPTRGWGQVCDFVNSLVSQCPAYIVHAPLETAMEFITSKALQ